MSRRIGGKIKGGGALSVEAFSVVGKGLLGFLFEPGLGSRLGISKIANAEISMAIGRRVFII